MSQRSEQVASNLKKALVQVFQRKLADPRIRGMISITKIDLSPDFRNAKVYVSVLPDKYQNMTVDGLNAAKKHINSHVKKYLAMRIVPLLTFELDQSLKQQAEIFDAIREGLDREKANNSQQLDAEDNNQMER